MDVRSSIKNTPRRIVLFPHGPAGNNQAQESLTRLLVECGADYSRFIDTSFPGMYVEQIVQKFVNYISRAHIDKNPEFSHAIVALTRTNPPALTIQPTRRIICNAHPGLNNNLWVIYADLKENPFILENLKKCGQLEDCDMPVPNWRDDDGNNYLILMPNCTDVEFLKIKAGLPPSRRTSAFTRNEPSSSSRLHSQTSVESDLPPTPRRAASGTWRKP